MNAFLTPLTALFAGSFLGAIGQVLLKLGADGATRLPDYLNLKLASGLAAYGIGTLLWIWALSRVPLNLAYAFTALTFLLVYLASVLVIGERLPTLSYVGLALVLSGFLLLSFGPR
jgi:undecaprenyl phosphate-alpha-L-ara4N flippase subunit ArnE